MPISELANIRSWWKRLSTDEQQAAKDKLLDTMWRETVEGCSLQQFSNSSILLRRAWIAAGRPEPGGHD